MYKKLSGVWIMAYTTIDDPSAHFQALSYSGGSGSLARTFDGNSDLQPDLTWHKSIGQTYDHYLFDSTRGVGLYLKSNSTVGDDGTGGDTTSLTSFDSDGFTLPGGTGISDPSAAIMCWGWKANGGTTTTNDASSTGVGSIDSVYQANTTAGFSIVTWTGTGSTGTIGHGLSSTPDWILLKNRDSSKNWIIYHKGIPNSPNVVLFLNLNNEATDQTRFNDTSPTSSVFSIGSGSTENNSGDDYIAYCFAEKQGYSKFGSYKGNYNADGPFIYTGFKPAFVLVKEADNANDWDLRDSARDPQNHVDTWLRPNSSDADGDSDAWDFLSNGFKIRQASNRTNRSGGTLIYAAFAEQPFVSSEGIPCTAR